MYRYFLEAFAITVVVHYMHCTYRFILEPTVECPRDICSMITVTPQHGTLSPTDRPATIQITFQSNREVIVKDQPILRCQVVEPTIGDSGEMIASIPIKVTVRSTFTKSVSACVLNTVACTMMLILTRCLYTKFLAVVQTQLCQNISTIESAQ